MTHPKNTQYQQARRAALEQAAIAAGFKSASEMMTAIIHGTATVVRVTK